MKVNHEMATSHAYLNGRRLEHRLFVCMLHQLQTMLLITMLDETRLSSDARQLGCVC